MENVTTEKRNMSAEKITRADRIWLRLMDIGGHLGCHQLESHSFSIGGYQMPLCARCTGILLGDVFGIAMILFGIYGVQRAAKPERMKEEAEKNENNRAEEI